MYYTLYNNNTIEHSIFYFIINNSVIYYLPNINVKENEFLRDMVFR